MSTPIIQIRQVQANEIDELACLSIKTFSDAFAHQNTTADMELYLSKTFNTQSLLDELNQPENYFYFALIESEVVGYIKISYSNNSSIEIERLYISAAHQGKSIGEQLINYVTIKATKLGFSHITLGVWEHNLKAIRFYERHGFKKFSEHDFILGTDRQTDWLMKKVLC